MGDRKPVTVRTLREMKRRGRRIVALTAYDCQMAALEDRAGVDVILVGDSLGMVVLGHETTIPVTVDDMVHHLRAVTASRPAALVVGDMPFMSYQAAPEDAVRNAGRLVKEGGAQAVKLEGGRRVEAALRAVVAADIPVMGHLGLTPQSIHRFGGYRVQGRGEDEAQRLVDEARFLEDAGCFSVVLEGIPWRLARRITETLEIPTIGIGAGPHCDGQVLVVNDLLGLGGDFTPKFVRRYANLSETIVEAVSAWARDVRDGAFPDLDHAYDDE